MRVPDEPQRRINVVEQPMQASARAEHQKGETSADDRPHAFQIVLTEDQSQYSNRPNCQRHIDECFRWASPTVATRPCNATAIRRGELNEGTHRGQASRMSEIAVR